LKPQYTRRYQLAVVVRVAGVPVSAAVRVNVTTPFALELLCVNVALLANPPELVPLKPDATLLLSPVEFDTRPALGFRAADRVRSFGAALERARDESFEYRGAYESRGALSLAERSAYGIGDAALHRQARPATLQKPRKIVAPQFQTRTPNVAPVRIRVRAATLK